MGVQGAWQGPCKMAKVGVMGTDEGEVDETWVLMLFLAKEG